MRLIVDVCDCCGTSEDHRNHRHKPFDSHRAVVSPETLTRRMSGVSLAYGARTLSAFCGRAARSRKALTSAKQDRD
jgi:hypothetical protein